MTRQILYFQKLLFTLFMRSEIIKSAEKILIFLPKRPPTLFLGSKFIESAHIFLNFFNFSFFRQNHSPLLLLWGHAMSTLVKIISKLFSLHISVGDYLSEFQRWFSKSFSKIHPPTFLVGTEFKRIGVISIKFF